MSERKGSDEILNNGSIESQNSNTDTKVTIEKDDVKIEIINNAEETKAIDYEDAKTVSREVNLDNLINNYEGIKVIDCEDAKKELRDVNLDKDGIQNYVVGMAFAAARPDGMLIGWTPQTQIQTSSGDSPPPAPIQQSPWHSPEEESIDPHAIMVYTPESRNRFIRCVLSCVFIMLLATAAFIAFVFALPDVKEWFQIYAAFLIFPILCFIMSINYVITWYLPCTRRPPGNIICLVLTVISMSLLSAVLSSYYSTDVILYAFIATTVVVFVCIVLACTNFDFTSCLLYFIVITIAFLVLSAIILFIVIVIGAPLNPTFVVLIIGGTLLQVLMLTMNLQMIIGGKTIEINENDYALGAYMVYMAIIDIFIKMVYSIGHGNSF